jgi:hypothetical protein
VALISNLDASEGHSAEAMQRRAAQSLVGAAKRAAAQFSSGATLPRVARAGAEGEWAGVVFEHVESPGPYCRIVRASHGQRTGGADAPAELAPTLLEGVAQLLREVAEALHGAVHAPENRAVFGRP